MGRPWIVVAVMACSSSKPPPDLAKWMIQSEAHGGKPPGVNSVTTLGWDGHYRHNRTFGDDIRGCDVVVPANLIAAITNAVAKVNLPKPGLPAPAGGSYYEWTALTLGEEAYAMPKSPELDAAVAEAMTAGAKLCTPASAPPVDVSKWTIQREAVGGKPPGIHTVTTLGSDGRYRHHSKAENPKPDCDVVVAVAAVTAALAKTTPQPGPGPRGGSYYESSVLTLGESRYAMPKSPELGAAVAEAMTAGAKLCTK